MDRESTDGVSNSSYHYSLFFPYFFLHTSGGERRKK